MGRLSVGGSAKKNKQRNSLGSPLGKVSGDGATLSLCDGQLPVSVIFQHDKATSDECSTKDILLTLNQMTALQLRSGNYVIVRLGEGSVLCRAWMNRKLSQSQLSTEAAVLNKTWCVGIVEEQKAICLEPLSPSVRMMPCLEIVLSVSSEAEFNTASKPLFRSYLKDLLLGASLQTKISIGVSMFSQKCLLTVHKLVGDNTTGCEGIFFWTINAQSRIQIVRSDRLPLDLVESNAVEPLVSIEEAVNRVHASFVGYDKEVRLAIDVLAAGLQGHKSSGDWKPPKGMLICGPVGVGKTALASALLSAFACDVVHLDSKILLQRLDGSAEAEMRKVFAAAANRTPCVILMENMHLLCPSRSASTIGDAEKRLVSCWLTLVDGLSSSANVFILGTSSRPGDLDAAVRRPGRIDREIELSVPSQLDRQTMLVSLAQRYGVLSSQDVLHSAAQQAHGMVASDLVLLLKEAVFHAVKRRQVSEVSTESILEQKMQQMTLSPLRSPTSPMPRNSPFSPTSPQPAPTENYPTQPIEVIDEDWSSALQRISPSALREVFVEVPTVRWTDIGGMDGVKQALRQVVELPMDQSEAYQRLGLGALKGVLLYGPPGCSKTLLAKAIATECSMNFIAVRGPELLSKWVGESEKAVQALFRRARAAAPAVVFFDEIDALAGTRGESSSGVSDRVLSQLLTELDGMQGLNHVVVVAATNRPDMLDPALVRPGRIDRKIYVPPPDDESRRRILMLELAKLPTQEPIDLSALVKLSDGFSGAEVVSICNEAALRALERDSDFIDQPLLEEAARQVKPQIDAPMLAFYHSYRQKHRTF